ncbi:hypothetical protein Aduo_015893 [Ancylostoma duodenale]
MNADDSQELEKFSAGPKWSYEAIDKVDQKAESVQKGQPKMVADQCVKKENAPPPASEGKMTDRTPNSVDLISNSACITAESENKQSSPNPTNVGFSSGIHNQTTKIFWQTQHCVDHIYHTKLQIPPMGAQNPVPPSAPVPVAAQVPNSRPAAASSSPAMVPQTPPPTPAPPRPPPIPQQLPVVPPVPPRLQATPVSPRAPVRVAAPAPPSKPAVAPPSPAMATRPSPRVEKSKTVTPPPPVTNVNEKKPPPQNRAAVAAQPSRPGKALPTPPKAVKEKKSGQAAAVKPPAPVRTADSKAKVPSPGNKKGSNTSPQPRARSSSAKRCVSDPILTPVTDEFPTEEWEGQWVAPKEIIVEERRKWPWKEEKAAGGGTKPKQAPASPAAVVVQKEQPRTAPVAATQVQAPVRCRSVPLGLNAPNILSAASKNVSAKKCLSDPIVTPVTDEFPSEENTGEWVAPKQIIALERRHFVRRDDCLDGVPHKGDDRVISNPVVTPCTDEYPTLSEGEREAFLKETAKAKEVVKPPQPLQPAHTPSEMRTDMNTQTSTTVTPVARSRASNERTNATQVAGSTEANRSKGQSNSKEQPRKKGKRKSRRARDTKRDKKEKSKGVIETIAKILKPCSKRSHSKVCHYIPPFYGVD